MRQWVYLEQDAEDRAAVDVREEMQVDGITKEDTVDRKEFFSVLERYIKRDKAI